MESSTILEHQLSTTLNTNIFHSWNTVYITIRWSEWSCKPTQTSPCTLKKRATFSSEGREVYSMEKSRSSNLLKTVLKNKTSLTLIITVRLLVHHDSLTQLGSLLLGIWITSFLKNLNINFIGKSVQCKLLHQEGTHATTDHRQVLKNFFYVSCIYIYLLSAGISHSRFRTLTIEETVDKELVGSDILLQRWANKVLHLCLSPKAPQ